jgi:hypothetical protein
VGGQAHEERIGRHRRHDTGEQRFAADIEAALGYRGSDEMIHRDDMAITESLGADAENESL